ncbi:MAG: sulfotransferase [Calditrichaeota bacterium]|nr:sulfotransferase [Calditrichota bacterium]
MQALVGITLGDLFKLFKENNYKIEGKYWKRVLFLFISGLINSRDRKKEDKLFGAKIHDVKIEKPLFILGHWRSGTTLLHSLISMDEQFAFSNLFQVSRPHQFLFRGEMMEKRFAQAKAQNRPMDNMKVTFRDPGEDESGLSVLSQRSPLIGWTFPDNHSYYTKYHTFADVPNEDLERWQESLLYFFKKLTWLYNKPLVLKSPNHTARIKILLEMFPDARFVHISRDPYTVFLSTQRLYNKMLPLTCLQTPDLNKWDDNIINDYKTMYDAYFEQKSLIPENQFCEIKFEDLEENKIAAIEKIYSKLNLDNFGQLKTKIQEFDKEHKDYKKNKHIEISQDLVEKINTKWEMAFTRFGYAKRKTD